MTEPRMIFDSFIDMPLWNRAKWRGVGYLCFNDRPPVFGLYFENASAGEEIFRQWKSRLGNTDEHNQLRISIVEGPILGADPGYNIRIGSNTPSILKLAKEHGLDVRDTGVMYLSRIHRMNPPPGSENLHQFKTQYGQHKSFDLAQVAPTHNGGMTINPESLIRKTEIHLRQIEYILDGDLDRDAIVAPP